MNYFVHDTRDLSPAYVKKCERFLWSLRNAGLVTKQQANTLFKLQAWRPQASSSKLHYTPTGILLGVDLGPRPKPRAPSSKRHEPDTIK